MPTCARRATMPHTARNFCDLCKRKKKMSKNYNIIQDVTHSYSNTHHVIFVDYSKEQNKFKNYNIVENVARGKCTFFAHKQNSTHSTFKQGRLDSVTAVFSPKGE
jgi:hypothetical protein